MHAVSISIFNLMHREEPKERKDTLVLGPPRPSKLLCTVDQLYFPWSKFQTQTPSSYSRAHSLVRLVLRKLGGGFLGKVYRI